MGVLTAFYMEGNMKELGIEKSLKKAAKDSYYKYNVLKHRLLTTESTFWASAFPGGNDHGPEHIKRVLQNLDKLLGASPLRANSLNAYELFLAMMAILYHDVGILRQRKDHAMLSKLFLEIDRNDFIFDPRDKEVIALAVVSHSSSRDIELEASAFAQVETIGGQRVRPRVVAALVRFADELDEDYRRANSTVMELLELPEESKFYWQFCQRIQGIEPCPSKHEIVFYVEFKNEDVGKVVQAEGKGTPFLSAFAEKISKINRERVVVNRFLPEKLQYHKITLEVKPLRNDDKWKRPRAFVFNDESVPSEFVASYPELLLQPAAGWLELAITAIQTGDFYKAEAELERLDEVMDDLPGTMRLRSVYLKACIASLQASKHKAGSYDRRKLLARSKDHLQEWLGLIQTKSFLELHDTANNAIHRMSRDDDLECLLSERKASVVRMIPNQYHATLPRAWQPRTKRKKAQSWGGGGCVPLGTAIETLIGEMPIEELQKGSEILSMDLSGKAAPIVTTVIELHRSIASECIRLNQKYLFTPTQPVYESERGWVSVTDLIPGMCVLDKELRPQPIVQIERIKDHFEVYTLTTDHPSHNYLAYGLICGNKRSL
jgi:hypothetical protein